MALLSFPLTLDQFFHLLPVAVAKMSPGEALEIAETGSGEILTADIGTTLWTGQIDLGKMLHVEAADIGPLLNILRRPGRPSWSRIPPAPGRDWTRRAPSSVLLPRRSSRSGQPCASCRSKVCLPAIRCRAVIWSRSSTALRLSVTRSMNSSVPQLPIARAKPD